MTATKEIGWFSKCSGGVVQWAAGRFFLVFVVFVDEVSRHVTNARDPKPSLLSMSSVSQLQVGLAN